MLRNPLISNSFRHGIPETLLRGDKCNVLRVWEKKKIIDRYDEFQSLSGFNSSALFWPFTVEGLHPSLVTKSELLLSKQRD